MNVVAEIKRINEKELESNIVAGLTAGSWHDTYKKSAWVYFGGLPDDLSEGDIVCIASQFGEVEDINLVRDKGTGASKGFCFLKYEDQRSTVLAVDNLNGTEVLGRTLRCDHVDKYKLPKEVRDKEGAALEADATMTVELGPGHAYKGMQHENKYRMNQGVDLYGTPVAAARSDGGLRHHSSEDARFSGENGSKRDKKKKEKKEKKERKEKKEKKEHKEKKEKKDKKESKGKRDRINSDDMGADREDWSKRPRV
jgi:RNA-binding motif protein, X-linked 2